MYGVSPNVPASLLHLVQEQIDQRTAYPLVGLAIAYLDSPSCRSKKASRAGEGGELSFGQGPSAGLMAGARGTARVERRAEAGRWRQRVRVSDEVGRVWAGSGITDSPRR